jgi:membrane protein required for colicin V production
LENNFVIDFLKDFYETISIIDLIYLIITILSLITCYKKGFVLSILSMAKWLFAYVDHINFISKNKTLFQKYN